MDCSRWPRCEIVEALGFRDAVMIKPVLASVAVVSRGLAMMAAVCCQGRSEATWCMEGYCMATLTLEIEAWAEQQFGACDLGDQRRTERAVKFAAQMASNPSGSTPKQTQSWHDCKAAYRLLDCEDVTFAALIDPHCAATRAQASGHMLLLGDTTEVEFGIHRAVEGLGPTGDGRGRGFFLHSSLVVDADGEEIVGLAAQHLFYRQPRQQSESRYDRVLRRRESEVWGRVIDEIGPAPVDTRFTHVYDRGADNFEVLCHLVMQKQDWVIRVAQLQRKIQAPSGMGMRLNEYLASLPVAGTYEIQLRARKGQPARTAKLEMRFGQVGVPAPKHRSRWLKECGILLIVQWLVEVREVDAPAGVKPLHWVLYTSHALETFEDAWRIVEYYERRWLIEEYHKALKTGCRVEERQFKTAHRLEAVMGFVSVVAVRLLQLKSIARTDPEQPARTVVPPLWLEVLQKLRNSVGRPWTVRDFYRHLAGLGGFLGRKCDGEPGWITIWRGFEQLVPALRYAERTKKCG